MSPRHLRRCLTFCALAGALSALSCSRTPIGPCDEASGVSVSVGAGVTPAVTWAPTCLVGNVLFEQINGTSRQFMFESFDPDNRIASGHVYGDGQTPSTTFSPGFIYKVTVGLVVGGDAVATLGSTTFTR